MVKNSEGESRIGSLPFIARSVRGGSGGSDKRVTRILPVTDTPAAVGRVDDVDPGVFRPVAGHGELFDNAAGSGDEVLFDGKWN